VGKKLMDESCRVYIPTLGAYPKYFFAMKIPGFKKTKILIWPVLENSHSCGS
jgi:hypothetical protein